MSETSAEQLSREEIYTHGHHESVLRSHRWRTVENSAAYLVDRLREGADLLDVGCGPGTLTVDLARLVAPGKVVGIDSSSAVLDEAITHAADEGVENVSFQRADVYELPFDDDSFDVVHAHQLLQHLVDPVAALKELQRVCRPGGIIAVREADYGAMTWFPESADLAEWNELYHEVTEAIGVEADAGRHLLSWAHEAGFDPESVTATASVWVYASEDERRWWGELWAERCVASRFGAQAQAEGLADDVALEQLAHGWRDWAEERDAWFAVLNSEIIIQL